MKRLIELGVNVNAKTNKRNSALVNAARFGFDKCLTLLINAGANVNSIEKRGGFTALTYASLGQHLTTMRILIEAEVDVNLRNARGQHTVVGITEHQTSRQA